MQPWQGRGAREPGGGGASRFIVLFQRRDNSSPTFTGVISKLRSDIDVDCNLTENDLGKPVVTCRQGLL